MDALFELEPLPPAEKMSYGRRLTLRAASMLDRGKHPANSLDVRPDLGKCGDCVHFKRYGYRNRTYLKCQHHRLGESHSEASDMRASWPACPKFEKAEG